MENCYLFDDKEMYMQIINPSNSFEFINPLQPNNCYHILIREWNPETWEMGTLFEIKIDKSTYASKFATFLSEKVFPHISSEHLYCCKVNFLKNFKRGDLVLKRWSKLKH